MPRKKKEDRGLPYIYEYWMSWREKEKEREGKKITHKSHLEIAHFHEKPEAILNCSPNAGFTELLLGVYVLFKYHMTPSQALLLLLSSEGL